jgi:N-acetylglucosamine malate deacetylase 1
VAKKKEETMNVLVIAPHPDDEVLGVGGTIARLAAGGADVTVAIVTKGWEPLFPKTQVDKVRGEAVKANDVLGVKSLRFMDMPVTKLNRMPSHEMNAAFDRLVAEEKPEIVYLPFPGDRHTDHREVFEAAMVALRPTAGREYVKRILCYETVSETHWSTAYIESNFEPNQWTDISSTLDTKLRAMQEYQSQVRPAPDARSIEALRSLAVWRGSVMGMKAAECFTLIRERWMSR